MLNNDAARVVRKNIERSEERERERRFQLRREFQMQADLLDAVSLARKAAQIGLVPPAIWILWVGSSMDGLFGSFGLVIGCLGLGIVYYFAPIASGFAAHFWFRDCAVSARRTAVALTLLIEATVFGWIVVLTS